MTTIRALMLLAAVVAASAGVTVHAAAAADLKVIANPSVTAASISAAELKDIFLTVKTSFGGVAVEPVLSKQGAAHEAFLREYLGKNEATLSTYFRSLVFTGRAAMPKVCASDAEVIDYVARTKGAIGYVSADASAPGTKTLGLK